MRVNFRKSEYANHWDKVGRKAKYPADSAYEPLQTVGFAKLDDEDELEFGYLAEQYKLEGDSPEKLCRWNREVSFQNLYAIMGCQADEC